MSSFASGLLLRVDRFELGLRAREFDLAGEGLVELSQLVEIVTNGSKTLRLLDSGSNLGQLIAVSEDDFFRFFVENANEGLSPWFVDREVELEFLLRSSISVPKDSHVRLEDPGGGL